MFDLSEAHTAEFQKKIDHMVLVRAQTDPELAAGFKELDRQAQERGLTFYEISLIVWKKQMASRKAADWMKGRN